jgi:hypothetical protein
LRLFSYRQTGLTQVYSCCERDRASAFLRARGKATFFEGTFLRGTAAMPVPLFYFGIPLTTSIFDNSGGRNSPAGGESLRTITHR